MKYVTVIILVIVYVGLSCTNIESDNTEGLNQVDYKETGLNISNASQAVLFKNVSTQIQTKGVESAILFCNVNATPVTDSLSEEHNVKISRVSNKNRNPKNALSENEMQLWSFYASSWPNKSDTIIKLKDQITYYKPIGIGMPTCLKCHGNINQIDSTTLTTINHLYPKDKATGYQLNELRGFWKIEFN